MNTEDRKRLDYIVGELARLDGERKDLAEQMKELIDAAYDDLGVSRKVVKRLAKERGWTSLEREEQKMLEEELDMMRSALGMLADTPLGEAATKSRLGGRMKDLLPAGMD